MKILPHPFQVISLLFAVTGLFMTACATDTADRSAEIPAQTMLLGKTKQEVLACAGAPRRESTAEGLSVMLYQEEAELVERSIPGAKSSGVRDRPHGCRALLTLQDGRVTGMRYESVPAWLGAEDHCKAMFARCAQAP